MDERRECPVEGEKISDGPSYAEQMLMDVCHEEQVAVWADELAADLAGVLVDPKDYGHGLEINDCLKVAVVSLARTVIEETLYREGRITKPWADDRTEGATLSSDQKDQQG
jgi:hypothetical protein